MSAHRALWREAFSVRYCFKRIARAMFRLRLGALLMCAMMNLFYCLKALRGNAPAIFGRDDRYAEYRHLPGLPEPGAPNVPLTPRPKRQPRPAPLGVG